MNYTQLITEAQEHQKGKVCSICKEHKSFSEYYPHSTCKDGFGYICKSCQKQYNDNMFLLISISTNTIYEDH